MSAFKYLRANYFKQILVAILLWLASGLLISLHAQTANVGLTQEEIQWIKENPVIRISNPSTISPFIINKDGEAEGLAIDYIKLLTSKVGLEFEIPAPQPWNVMMDMLRNDQIDLMHTTVLSPERLEYMAFSIPYMNIPMVDYGRVGGKSLNSPSDLRNLKVGIIAGFATTDDYLEEYPDGNYVEFDTVTEALYALSVGNIDIFTNNMVTSNYTIIQNLIPNLELHGTNKLLNEKNVVQHFASTKENQILIDIFNKAMRATTNTEFIEIAQKWQVRESVLTKPQLELTQEEKQWMLDNPTVKIANPFSIAPFNFTENGEVKGFAVDYINLLAQKAGINIEFVEETNWNQMMDQLSTEEIHLIHSAAQNEERLKTMNFTEPYLEIPMANVGRVGEGRVNSPDDLINKRIALVKGYSTAKDFKAAFPGLNFIEFETLQDALIAVSSNQADIYTGNMISINFAIIDSFIPNLEILGINDFLRTNIVDHRLGALHKNKPLISIMQKAMDQVSNEEFFQISQKWREMGLETTVTGLFLNTEERRWIQDNPIVSVANPTDSAPFSFNQNGNMVGIAVDYLNIIAEMTGLKFNYDIPVPWSDMIERFKNNEIDILHSSNKNQKREEFALFSSPYLKMPNVIMGRAGSDQINQLSDLEGKSIGLVKGYVLTQAYKSKLPDNTYIEYDTMTEALRALSSSEVDIVSGNNIFINYLMATNFIPGLEVIGQDMVTGSSTIDHHFGVTKDNQILLSIIEKALSRISSDQIIAISNKWQNAIEESNRADIGLTDVEKNWLSANPIVKLAFDPNLPPMIFINDQGQIDGMASDYLEIIEDRLNIQFEWIENSSIDDAINAMQNGSADILPLFSETPERNEFLTFTDSIVSVSHMIFSREGGEIYSNLDSLNGRTIAQVPGYDITEKIKANYPGINIIDANSVEEALRMVSSGEADANVGSLPLATYHSAERSLSNITVVGETEFGSENAIAIRKDLPLLASAIQKALSSITSEQRGMISRNWVGLQAEPQINYNLLWRVIGFAALIIIFFAIWNTKLKEAQAKAEAANAAKSAFLANMSHEIRTPLNAIMGFSDAMLNGLGGEIKNERHREYLLDIKNSGDHLSTVINDILDLSKIESGKWQLREDKFLLNDCLAEALKMVQSKADDKKINIGSQSDKDYEVYGDLHSIKRIFINLLANAVKYTQEDGTIICTITSDPSGGVKIEITDNGIGIPENRLEEVLLPFEQTSDSHELDEEGTGLGLAIVDYLIKAHDGKFILSSELGLGTTAGVILPPERVTAS